MNLCARLCAAALAFTAAAANAHDTWFELRPSPPDGRLLALGTGDRWPLYETGIDAQYLSQQGCRVGAATLPMQPLGNEPASLLLRAPPQASSCWVELTPFEVEVSADKVPLYLKELGAGAELRATWARMQSRGVPWKERYTKHARIVFDNASAAAPVPMGMDVLIEPPGVQPGQALHFVVLRDGQPLAGLPMELRSANSPLGIWRRTDAAGRVALPALPAGRWLLRGIDLRVSATDPDRWESRFVTLAFEVPAVRKAAAPG